MLASSPMNVVAGTAAFTLACHPQTPSKSIREIDVVVEEAKSGSLMLTFCLVGDISSLSIPESRSSQRAEHLWRHTCFEAFVMAGEGPEYLEFNFSPSGEWAVYEFRGYRDGGERKVALNATVGGRGAQIAAQADFRTEPGGSPEIARHRRCAGRSGRSGSPS